MLAALIQFERAIPVAVQNVDRKDGDLLPLRFFQQLRWLIKTHRLTIDEARDERGGVMVLQVTGQIRQQCERSRMRFRKTVLSKSLDLPAMLRRTSARSPSRSYL